MFHLQEIFFLNNLKGQIINSKIRIGIMRRNNKFMFRLIIEIFLNREK